MGFEHCIEKGKQHFSENLPFAIYREPGRTRGRGIFQNRNTVVALESFKEEGFLMAPFDSESKKVLIRADQVMDWNDPISGRGYKDTSYPILESSETREEYTALVRKTVDEILEGELQKVVLSRSIECAFEGTALSVFHYLLVKYPQAFCYLWYHPSIGTWLGATPETFLSLREGRFSTMALAGTKPYLEGEKPQWTTKEYEEQGLVTEHIQNVIGKYTSQYVVGPRTEVKAGNLWHLKTEIKGRLQPSYSKELIEALHPTPAVCGLPVSASKSFIINNENYPREYYTGFLGGLNLEGENTADLYVNLRCMQLQKNLATIYVGGGITKDSIPDLEWEETVLKSRTMMNALAASQDYLG